MSCTVPMSIPGIVVNFNGFRGLPSFTFIALVCTAAQRFSSSIITACSTSQLSLLLTTLSISLIFSFSPFSAGTCLCCVSHSTSCLSPITSLCSVTSVYGRFPESQFPGKTFPGKYVSRKVTFPERRFPERSFKRPLATVVFSRIVRGGFRILERGSFRQE